MSDEKIDKLLLALHNKAESVDCMWGLPLFSEYNRSELREIVRRHVEKSEAEMLLAGLRRIPINREEVSLY